MEKRGGDQSFIWRDQAKQKVKMTIWDRFKPYIREIFKI